MPLEYFEGSSWNTLSTLTNITLTGAVTGSGGSTISTVLNSFITQTSNQSFNFTNSKSTFDLLFPNSGTNGTKIRIGRQTASSIGLYGFEFQSTTLSNNTAIFNFNFSGINSVYNIFTLTENLPQIMFNSYQLSGLLDPIAATDAVTKNYADTSILSPSRITGYPSNSSLFLNGLGSWTAPSFSNLITTNLISYSIALNNTNPNAYDTSFAVQNNGTLVTSFGFNNSTNEAYMWGYGTANLKFGTANIKRMQILNNGTLDLLNNDLITTGNISAQTGTLKGNNLAAYNTGEISVLNSLYMSNNNITGLATPINNQDAVNKNYADSSSITPSRISGYPSNSSLFLNGLGSWSTPPFISYLTTNLISYAITLNNTNASATATSFFVQNNGSNAVEFGFNNSTNEAYVWAYGASSLKFGTADTMRARFLNNGTFDLLTNNLTTSGTLIANNLSAYNSSVIVCSSPLSITGGYSPYNGSYGYLNPSGIVGTSSGQHSYSINCTNRVKASEFNAVSSKRVKNIISSDNIIEQEAIDIFNSISLSKYTYKDQINESKGEFFGVIAEELEEILPHYISNDYSFIPNVYTICNVRKIDSDLYDILLVKKLDDISGKKIRLLIKDKLIDVNIKTLKDNLLTIKTDNILPKEVFVYGTYEKCPSVAKQKLFELSMVVLKNILRRMENIETNIKFN